MSCPLSHNGSVKEAGEFGLRPLKQKFTGNQNVPIVFMEGVGQASLTKEKDTRQSSGITFIEQCVPSKEVSDAVDEKNWGKNIAKEGELGDEEIKYC